MSGADKLLKAKVVSDLCFLEGAANTKFTLSTLNTVRSWTAEKIKNTVNGMFEAYEAKPNTTLKFMDDRKVRRKRKNTKPKQASPNLQNSVQIFDQTPPPVGWEHYVDWTTKGDLAFLDELKTKLVEEDKKFQNQAGSTVMVIEDNADMIQIVDNVRKRVECMMKEGETNFDMAKLVTEHVSELTEQTETSCMMVVTGGVLRDELNLNQKDIKSITQLSWATDQAVMYTMMFLSNWTIPALKEVYVLDPVFTQGWWEGPIRVGTEAQRRRERRVREHPETRTNKHELVWRSSTSFIFMCGNRHWTVAVVFGLPHLLEWVQSNSDFLTASFKSSAPKLAKCLIFDSMQKTTSPHARFTANLIRYLCCANPGPELTELQLNDLLQVHEHRRELQKSAECGFFSTYHASLVLRNTEVFRTGTVQARRNYLDNSYNNYSFTHYAHIIQSRMRVMAFKYDKNGRQPVHSNIFLWDEDIVMQQEYSVVAPENRTQIKDMSADEPPSFRTRSKMKSLPSPKRTCDHEHDAESADEKNPPCNGNPASGCNVSAVHAQGRSVRSEANGIEGSVNIAQHSAKSENNGVNFVQALVNFTIRTSVENEYHQDTMNRVHEDPDFKKALLLEHDSKDYVQSIAALTPILAPYIQNALRRSRQNIGNSGNAINASESTISAAESEAFQSKKRGQPPRSSTDPNFDVASLVVEGMDVMKETKDEDIRKQWHDCMDHAKRLIEQAKKKRKLE